jgi:PAS domain S-box-containing protein
LNSEALKISSIYALAGSIWIYGSGRLAARINMMHYQELETYKGLFFIATTAALLFLLLKYFYRDQRQRIRQLEERELALGLSEKRYRMLFEHGPLPKWIFDVETLRFLDVNEEAVHHYGYSKEQFLRMTVKDVRPEKDSRYFEEFFREINKRNLDSFTTKVRHQTASGEIIEVEVHSNAIEYQGRKAKLVTVNDVTKREEYIKEIEQRNRILKDISWVQSHVVRSPLSSLMGFAALLKDEKLSDEDHDYVLNGILEAAGKLDRVIKEIVATLDRPESGDFQPMLTEADVRSMFGGFKTQHLREYLNQYLGTEKYQLCQFISDELKRRPDRAF